MHYICCNVWKLLSKKGIKILIWCALGQQSTHDFLIPFVSQEREYHQVKGVKGFKIQKGNLTSITWKEKACFAATVHRIFWFFPYEDKGDEESRTTPRFLIWAIGWTGVNTGSGGVCFQSSVAASYILKWLCASEMPEEMPNRQLNIWNHSSKEKFWLNLYI